MGSLCVKVVAPTTTAATFRSAGLEQDHVGFGFHEQFLDSTSRGVAYLQASFANSWPPPPPCNLVAKLAPSCDRKINTQIQFLLLLTKTVLLLHRIKICPNTTL